MTATLRTAVIVVCTLFLSAAWAQTPQDTAERETAEEVTAGQQDPAEREDNEDEDRDEEEDEDDIESPDTFVPTEEISEDNSISFPVDI